MLTSFLAPVSRFIHGESTAGFLLFAAAAFALIWANSPYAESYHALWHTQLAVEVGSFTIDKSLHHWISDGLMSMFFFVVGLEMKREIIAGELSSLRKALLPVGAAIGGMLVPACIYLFFNPFGEAGSRGWGIPMATDIAFALGILSLLGKRVPFAVKIFLTAVAIVDDIGAVLVIAFFYTSSISYDNLALGALALGVLIFANILGIRSTYFYGIVGIGGLWLAFLLSGVHATIAGIIAALAIPARPKIQEQEFVRSAEDLISRFRAIDPNNLPTLKQEQLEVIEGLRALTKEADTPLQRLEYFMHPPVAFLVLPIFALANAGISVTAETLEGLGSSVTLGIVCGLVFGKIIGVLGTTALFVRFGLAQLPQGFTWSHLFGASVLAGVGFTMSLFITHLAFTDIALVEQAKAGVLIASSVAGLLGYLMMRLACRQKLKKEEVT